MKKFLCLFLLALLPLCLAQAEEAQVVASFYPVYVMAENVLLDVPDVNLTCMSAPSTGCLHDYQLLTSDMRALSKATAMLTCGAGMESFLPQILEQFPELNIVDCSEHIELLVDEDDPDEENPHIWLSPLNAIQMVRNLSDGLSALLPQHAAQIEQNAADYIARLEQVDAELEEAIALLPHRDIVTFHEAFPYFADRYGLNIVAVAMQEPEEPLSPRLLTELVNTVRENGNPPLFGEPQYPNIALTIVHEETGAPVFALDSLVTGDGSLTAYEDGMRANLAALQAALGDSME